MMKRHLVGAASGLAVAFAALGGAAHASVQETAPQAAEESERSWGHGRRGGMRNAMVLRAAVMDSGGHLERSQFERLLGAEFDWRDRNGDGYLDADDASPARQLLGQARADDPNARERAERRVSREDFISHGVRVFDRVDADDDGVVTEAEMSAAAEAMREQRRSRRGEGRRGWRRGGR
jgi:hypothetical protein